MNFGLFVKDIIDPWILSVDGLIIQGQDNLYPWQEPEYVSIDAALKKKNIENWGQVADVEKEYLEELKVVFRPKK